jgi:hypothetical protein
MKYKYLVRKVVRRGPVSRRMDSRQITCVDWTDGTYEYMPSIDRDVGTPVELAIWEPLETETVQPEGATWVVDNINPEYHGHTLLVDGHIVGRYTRSPHTCNWTWNCISPGSFPFISGIAITIDDARIAVERYLAENNMAGFSFSPSLDAIAYCVHHISSHNDIYVPTRYSQRDFQDAAASYQRKLDNGRKARFVAIMADLTEVEIKPESEVSDE